MFLKILGMFLKIFLNYSWFFFLNSVATLYSNNRVQITTSQKNHPQLQPPHGESWQNIHRGGGGNSGRTGPRQRPLAGHLRGQGDSGAVREADRAAHPST